MVKVRAGGVAVGEFPYDESAPALYLSKAGGYVPRGQALTPILAHGLHYATSFFEGMRAYDTPYGCGLVEPWMNIIRFMHSASQFNPEIQMKVLEAYEEGAERILVQKFTAEELYRLAEHAYREGKNPELIMSVDVRREGGGFIREIRRHEFTLRAIAGKTARDFSMAELDAAIKALLFINGLVSEDYAPPELETVPGGYIRPVGWSAEGGLKLSTLIPGEHGIGRKEMYFAIATLPWKDYLDEEAYRKGLEVMVAPYERIGADMPSDAKVAGNYPNGIMNVNPAKLLGFGEVLALDRKGLVVEGSAENLFALFGGFAYTPSLKSGCLPGTTRDRVIRTLERLGITLKSEALPLSELKKADAILLTGTAAQFIHVSEISEVPAVREFARLNRLDSGPKSKWAGFYRKDFESRKTLINGGMQHPIVEKIRAEYGKMVLEHDENENPAMIEPAYRMDFGALASVMGLGLSDITTKGERRDIKSGYFSEKVNGLTQPDEMRKRMRAAAAIIKRGMAKAEKIRRVAARRR